MPLNTCKVLQNKIILEHLNYRHTISIKIMTQRYKLYQINTKKIHYTMCISKYLKFDTS